MSQQAVQIICGVGTALVAVMLPWAPLTRVGFVLLAVSLTFWLPALQLASLALIAASFLFDYWKQRRSTDS